jgi:hypothetical protein
MNVMKKLLKPNFPLLLSIIGIMIIFLLSEFRYNPFLTFIRLIFIYFFLIILPLLWIQYIIHNYDKLNREHGRKPSWRKSLIAEIIIALGALVIILMTQTRAFTWLSDKQYDDVLYFFAFCTIMSAIYISIELSKNQKYFSSISEIKSMNYMLIGFLIYLGPIGLTIIHKDAINIFNSLSDD